MKVFNKGRLQKEEEVRIEELREKWQQGSDIQDADIFKFPKLGKVIPKPKVLIPSLDIRQILISTLFNEYVIVIVCPYCMVHFEKFKPLLETGCVIPVLLGSYNKYPKRIVEEMSLFPHISGAEYDFLQLTRLFNESGFVCQHCIAERINSQLKKLETKDRLIFEDYADRFSNSISPATENDSILIDKFCAAIKAGSKHDIKKLCDLASCLSELRSCQTVGAIPTLRIDEYQKVFGLMQYFGIVSNTRLEIDADDIMSKGLWLDMPTGMSTDKYLSIVLPHKAKLKAISESILADSRDSQQQPSLSRLVATIGNINEQIRTAERTRRNQALQATVGLANNHPSLVTSLLVGGGLGLCTSMMGCAPSLVASASGISGTISGGVRWLTKAKKNASSDSRVQRYAETIIRDVKSLLAPIVASYLTMDIRSLQIWQIRNSLNTHK